MFFDSCSKKIIVRKNAKEISEKILRKFRKSVRHFCTRVAQNLSLHRKINMGSSCSSTRVLATDSEHMSRPTAEAGSPWILWEDEEGNRLYYNFRNGSYTSEEQQCDWQQYVDENNDAYWYNNVTHESSWNGPCSPPELPMLVHAVETLISQHLRSLPVVQASGMDAPQNVPVATAVPMLSSSSSDDI